MTPDHGELYNDGHSSGDSASAAAVARVGSPEVERASPPPRECTTECKDVVPEQSAFPEESKVADDVVDGQPAEVEEPIEWSSFSAPADFTDISPPPSDKSEQPDSVPQTPIKGLIAARPCRQSQRKLDSSFGATDVDDSDGPPLGQVAMGKLLMMEAQELHKIHELMRLPEDERVGVVGHRGRANELRMMVNCEQHKIGGTVRASSVQLEARQQSLVSSLMRAHKLSDGWHYKEIALEAAGLPDAVKAARAIELQEWQQLRKHTEGVCMALSESDQAAGRSAIRDINGLFWHADEEQMELPGEQHVYEQMTPPNTRTRGKEEVPSEEKETESVSHSSPGSSSFGATCVAMPRGLLLVRRLPCLVLLCQSMDRR